MRILTITNRFPRPGHQTDATYNGHQVDALAKHHEVRVIAPVAWLERVRDLGKVGAGRQSLRGATPVYHPTFWYVPKVREHRFGRAYARSIQGTVRKVLKDFRPDALLS